MGQFSVKCWNMRLDLVNFFGLPRFAPICPGLPRKYGPVCPGLPRFAPVCPGLPRLPRLPRLSRKLAPVVPKTLKHDLMSQIPK